MNWQYTPYIAALTLAAGIAVAVALYAWPRRATPGGIYFVLLMVAVAEWALGNAGELAALEIPAKIMWSKISYPGTVSVAPLWLLFAAGYSQRTQWLTRRRMAGLWVVPVIITGLAATNELHGMVWPRIIPTSDIPGAILIYEHGPGVWVNMVYSYLLLLLGTFWLVRATLLAPSLYRRQVGALLVGAAIPWVGNALYVADIVPLLGLDITPIAFTLTGLAIGWAIFRFQMLDIVPIARDLLVENMRDGVLVLDAHNRVVDINPAARRLIGCSAANAIGQQADVILAKWPELAACCRDSAKAQQEVVFEDKRTLQWLELHVSPLYDRRTQLTGRLLALHDITERKQAEAAVQAAMQKEMNLAHNIQMSLLPPAAPDIPGLDIAASSLPAR